MVWPPVRAHGAAPGTLTAGIVCRSLLRMARAALFLLITVLMAAPLVIGVTGCGGSNIVIGASPTPTSAGTPTRTPTPTPTPQIGTS